MKKFIYGIAAVYFAEALIGYIEKGSFDWGGTKPESVDVEAEQVPDAPVLTLLTKNGSISPTLILSSWIMRTCILCLVGPLSERKVPIQDGRLRLTLYSSVVSGPLILSAVRP